MSDRVQALPRPSAATIIACSAAIVTLVPVALHQLGALKHLPDPPCAAFDSDSITESQAAHPLGIPDGLLGLASYSTTMALMLAARKDDHAKHLLALKLAADGSLAAFNVVRQVVQFRKLCSWCTGTAAATAIMLFASRDIMRNAASNALIAVTGGEPLR
jgi:uncharacterized membrane protein